MLGVCGIRESPIFVDHRCATAPSKIGTVSIVQDYSKLSGSISRKKTGNTPRNQQNRPLADYERFSCNQHFIDTNVFFLACCNKRRGEFFVKGKKKLHALAIVGERLATVTAIYSAV
jgi:hypothetical protein